MKRLTLTAFVLAWAVLSAAEPLAAHHSFAGVFDAKKVVQIEGVVTRFDWVNPHSYIHITGKTDSGLPMHWALEGPSVAQLVRRHVDRTTIKVGDTIQVCGYSTRINRAITTETPGYVPSQLVLAELLLLPDGKKLEWSDAGQRTCFGSDRRISSIR